MPTYEYQCEDGHEWETVQGIKDEPVAVCALCGKPAKRLISRTSFQLKGGGWTPTTYGR